MRRSIKVLHTSDWHLGLTLNKNDREVEFKRFLDWLKNTINEEKIDVLVVAGDIFDVSMPKNSVQKLYYRFLSSLQSTCCSHTVIVAGNHDSPTLLSAPADVLEAINVKVIGSLPEDIADEVFVLDGENGSIIVGAAPYLRSADIAKFNSEKDSFNLDEAVNEGIRRHYEELGGAIAAKQPSDGEKLPVLVTGHLFAQDGKVLEGDGVRNLYVGNLKGVDGSVFPECADYVALGHLHVPQTVGGSEFIRYSGSPLPVGFNEASQQKLVCVIEFTYGDSLPMETEVRSVNIPRFRELRQISGDKETILAELKALAADNPKTEDIDELDIWLEAVHTGSDSWSSFADDVNEACRESRLKVIISKDQGARERDMEALKRLQEENKSLEELDVYQVFDLVLQANNKASEEREALKKAYGEIIRALDEQDANA